MRIVKHALAFAPFLVVSILAMLNMTPATFNLFGYGVATSVTWLLILSCLFGYASGVFTAHDSSCNSIRRRLCEAKRSGKLDAVFTSPEATKQLESVVGPLDR